METSAAAVVVVLDEVVATSDVDADSRSLERCACCLLGSGVGYSGRRLCFGLCNRRSFRATLRALSYDIYHCTKSSIDHCVLRLC